VFVRFTETYDATNTNACRAQFKVEIFEVVREWKNWKYHAWKVNLICRNATQRDSRASENRGAAQVKLKDYQKKRDFEVTSEPSGKGSGNKKSGDSLIYVIQKHRATQLHYDFRLEWKGTLLSWAVPKGPSLDPSVKRLATQVEDHPIDYAAFEGAIPEGEYGGGTVMIWDNGTWEPEGAGAEAGLEKGDLKFKLFGKKLKGSWVLVRTRGFGSSTKPSWLLIKHRDEYASTEDVTAKKFRSVVSNRLLAEIARDEGGDVEKAATGDPGGKVPLASAKKQAAPSSRTSKKRSKK
jgi:bifunctional non-homologous end joining protein LigD